MSLKIPKNANIAAFDSDDADTTALSFTSRISGRPWRFMSPSAFMIAPLQWQRKNDWAAVFVAIILVFLGAAINGWVVIATRAAAILTSTEGMYIKSVIMALVSAGTFYVTSLWTYSPLFPNIIHPEIAISMLITGRIGPIVALGYLGVATAGFALGGVAANSIGFGFTPSSAIPIVNSATSPLSYVLYWFGGTIIVFSYIFNYWFRQQKDEKDLNPEKNLHHSHKRGALAATIAIFLLTIAFSTSTVQANTLTPPILSPLNGIYTFFSGQFFSGWVMNQAAMPPVLAAAPNVYQGPYWYFVALLAVPGTVMVVVLALLLLDGLGNRVSGVDSTSKRLAEEDEMAPASTAPAAAKISRRLVGRDVQVNYSY